MFTTSARAAGLAGAVFLAVAGMSARAQQPTELLNGAPPAAAPAQRVAQQPPPSRPLAKPAPAAPRPLAQGGAPAGPAAATIAPPTSQAAPASEGRWTVECQAQGNACVAVQRTMRADGKMQLVAIQVGPDGRQPQRIVATILLPLGIAVRESIPMIVDERFVAVLPIETCIPAGCVATVTMVPALEAVLSRGSELRFLALTAEGNTAVLPINLKGFPEVLAKIKTGTQ